MYEEHIVDPDTAKRANILAHIQGFLPSPHTNAVVCDAPNAHKAFLRGAVAFCLALRPNKWARFIGQKAAEREWIADFLSMAVKAIIAANGGQLTFYRDLSPNVHEPDHIARMEAFRAIMCAVFKTLCRLWPSMAKETDSRGTMIETRVRIGRMETVFNGLRPLVLKTDELERQMLDTRFVSEVEWVKTDDAYDILPEAERRRTEFEPLPDPIPAAPPARPKAKKPYLGKPNTSGAATAPAGSRKSKSKTGSEPPETAGLRTPAKGKSKSTAVTAPAHMKGKRKATDSADESITVKKRRINTTEGTPSSTKNKQALQRPKPRRLQSKPASTSNSSSKLIYTRKPLTPGRLPSLILKFQNISIKEVALTPGPAPARIAPAPAQSRAPSLTLTSNSTSEEGTPSLHTPSPGPERAYVATPGISSAESWGAPEYEEDPSMTYDSLFGSQPKLPPTATSDEPDESMEPGQNMFDGDGLIPDAFDPEPLHDQLPGLGSWGSQAFRPLASSQSSTQDTFTADDFQELFSASQGGGSSAPAEASTQDPPDDPVPAQQPQVVEHGQPTVMQPEVPPMIEPVQPQATEPDRSVALPDQPQVVEPEPPVGEPEQPARIEEPVPPPPTTEDIPIPPPTAGAEPVMMPEQTPLNALEQPQVTEPTQQPGIQPPSSEPPTLPETAVVPEQSLPVIEPPLPTSPTGTSGLLVQDTSISERKKRPAKRAVVRGKKGGRPPGYRPEEVDVPQSTGSARVVETVVLPMAELLASPKQEVSTQAKVPPDVQVASALQIAPPIERPLLVSAIEPASYSKQFADLSDVSMSEESDAQLPQHQVKNPLVHQPDLAPAVPEAGQIRSKAMDVDDEEDDTADLSVLTTLTTLAARMELDSGPHEESEPSIDAPPANTAITQPESPSVDSPPPATAAVFDPVSDVIVKPGKFAGWAERILAEIEAELRPLDPGPIESWDLFLWPSVSASA